MNIRIENDTNLTEKLANPHLTDLNAFTSMYILNSIEQSKNTNNTMFFQ